MKNSLCFCKLDLALLMTWTNSCFCSSPILPSSLYSSMIMAMPACSIGTSFCWHSLVPPILRPKPSQIFRPNPQPHLLTHLSPPSSPSLSSYLHLHLLTGARPVSGAFARHALARPSSSVTCSSSNMSHLFPTWRGSDRSRDQPLVGFNHLFTSGRGGLAA